MVQKNLNQQPVILLIDIKKKNVQAQSHELLKHPYLYCTTSNMPHTTQSLQDKDFIIMKLHRQRSNNIGQGSKLRWLLFLQVSGLPSLLDCSQMYCVTYIILISSIPSVSPKQQELVRHPFGKWPKGYTKQFSPGRHVTRVPPNKERRKTHFEFLPSYLFESLLHSRERLVGGNLEVSCGPQSDDYFVMEQIKLCEI